MVECPVGYRCKKCAGKITSHVLQVTPIIVARTIVVAAVVGYVAPYLMQFTGGFYGIVIGYFVGVLAGNLLHRVSGFKMGTAIVTTVVVGAIAGMLANPVTFRSYYLQNDLARLSQQMREQKTIIQNNAQQDANPAIESKAEKNSAAQSRAAVDPDNYDEDNPPMSPEQLEMTRQHFQSAQVWELIELAIFLAGMLTPFTGVVPALPFPFWRR